MNVNRTPQGTTQGTHQGTTRRQVVLVLPVAGLGLLAACSEQASAPAPAPAPPPAPAPAPAAPPPAAAPMPATQPPVADSAAWPMVAETDPQAVALAYVADATRIDPAKQPRHVAGQACANCSLYQGAADSDSGPCPLFAGKRVAAAGWCSAYAKKTG